MEENTENKEQETVEIEEEKPKTCIKMCIAMIVAAFLGGFLATYFVLDQMAERKFRHPYPPFLKMESKIFHDADRMYQKQRKDFEKLFDERNFKMPDTDSEGFIMPLYSNNAVKIETNQDEGNFNVVVGLKPFNDDENKIKYNVSGRKLTISGKSQVSEKGYEESISFSQDFILPENAIGNSIQKIKDGNKLIISVPLKN